MRDGPRRRRNEEDISQRDERKERKIGREREKERERARKEKRERDKKRRKRKKKGRGARKAGRVVLTAYGDERRPTVPNERALDAGDL